MSDTAIQSAETNAAADSSAVAEQTTAENTAAEQSEGLSTTVDTAVTEKNEPVSRSEAVSNLTKFLIEQENGNSETEESTKVETEKVEGKSESEAETEEKTEDATTDETTEAETKTEETETADSDKGAATEETSEADFDSFDKKPLPTLEELKAKYPRQKPELYAEAAEYAAEAGASREMVKNFGGKHYIEPLQKISQGIREQNVSGILQGINDAGSTEDVLRFIGDLMYVGFVKTESYLQNPETAPFGTELARMSDEVLKARFGESVTSEKIRQIAELEKSGWISKLTGWIENENVDVSEFFDTLNEAADPKLREANKKLREAEKKLAANDKPSEKKPETGKEKATESVIDPQVETAFGDTTTAAITEIFNAVVLRDKSVLLDTKSDSAELKEEKAALRDDLLNSAVNAFKSNKRRAELVKSYASNENSSGYKTGLGEAIEDSVKSIKAKTRIYERIVAKLHGKTRNAALPAAAKKTETAEPVETRTPTQTTDFSNNGKPKSREEIREELSRKISIRG